MNKTKIEWVKNPDGTQGYTWNPITGCLNGCEYCYARKLANTRLRERYLANNHTAIINFETCSEYRLKEADPFYPRFWGDRLYEPITKWSIWGRGKMIKHHQGPKGIFVCDMSDLFGIGIPEEWTKCVLSVIRDSPQHRFYLLTKQPQNLIKWSPFPENCFVGVSVTDMPMLNTAINTLPFIKSKIKYLSFEPLLSWECPNSELSFVFEDAGISWVIIGAQTKPYKPPKIEWVEEIVQACDKAGIRVFLKDNLKPLFTDELGRIFYPEWAINSIKSDWRLRQEMSNSEVG